jgi:Carbohydrate family 9 binding domain-like
VPRAAAPVSLGAALAEWDKPSRVSLSGRAHSTTAALLWDSTYLYVAFSANAPNRTPYSTTPAASGFGNDDTVEIYIDARNESTASRPTDPYHAVVRVLHDENRGSTLKAHGTRSAVAIAIPWTEIGVTPHPGMTLGVDLVVNHGGGSIIDSYDWARLAPQRYAQPALWNRVQLAGPALP